MRAAVVKEFNKNLRACLKKEGITQKMLAEFSGVPITTLGGWVSGGFSPSLTGVCMIAKVLRVTLDDLIPPEIYK